MNDEIERAFRQGYLQGKKEAVKRGHWGLKKRLGLDILCCSECEREINTTEYGEYYEKDFKFCPHCGAEMKEGD